jgi:hypothetical protein
MTDTEIQFIAKDSNGVSDTVFVKPDEEPPRLMLADGRTVRPVPGTAGAFDITTRR